jgi:hypothetical protein
MSRYLVPDGNEDNMGNWEDYIHYTVANKTNNTKTE